MNYLTKKLPALESAILKYRALEIVMYIHHAEQVKQCIFEPIKITHKILARGQEFESLKKGKVWQAIWKLMEDRNILDSVEIAELKELLNYRNTMAHHILQLLSYESLYTGDSYDYGALEKIRRYEAIIGQRFASQHFITTLRLPIFDSTEGAFEKELTALMKKINRLYAVRQTKRTSSTSSSGVVPQLTARG